MKQLITLVYSIEYVPCLKHNVKHFTYIEGRTAFVPVTIYR